MPPHRFQPIPIEQRFWKWVREMPTGCWEWTGSRTAPGWHGRVSVNGVMVMAHRVSWEMAHGPIPEGLSVLHHCDNPPCVNPDHLYLGTAKDNARDMVARGRLNSANARKTHCNHGHEFTPENTYRSPKTGRRQCATCRHIVQTSRPHVPPERECRDCQATIMFPAQRCEPCRIIRARAIQAAYGRAYRARLKAARLRKAA